MPRDGSKNLIPQNRRTKAEQKKIARKGGVASGKARREKRLMSQIYAELISNGLDEDIEKASRRVMRKGGSPAISLMRELREGTEGSKIKTETVLTINADDEKVQQVLKEFGINKAESKD
jgi:hypothetical protein